MSSEFPDRLQRNPETKSNAEDALQRSSYAIGQARKDQQNALSAKERPDDRRAALAGLVLDNWQEEDGVTICFGVEVDPQMVPERLVDLLEQIETEFGFDLIEGGLKPADIGDLLNDQLQADHAELDAMRDRNTFAHEAARAAEKSASKEAYRDLIDAAHASGKSNAEIIVALSQNPHVPEAERAKLAKFAQIIDVASQVPADVEIILARVDQIDLSNGVPDPARFARAFVFDTPGSALPSGVSDATQDAVAELIGVERPDLSVKTGDDMNEIFEKGVGTRTVRDSETGEFREEPVFLQPGEFEPIREGQCIGLTDRGERALKFDISVGGFIAPLPKNASDADMAMYGLAGQWLSRLHDVNMAEIFFTGRSAIERGGGILDIRMPDDFTRARRLCQIFFGGVKGYDGALLEQSDVDRIPYLMQFQNAKGDAVIGDINPEQMLAEYRRQGLVDKSGALDWDRFAKLSKPTAASYGPASGTSPTPPSPKVSDCFADVGIFMYNQDKEYLLMSKTMNLSVRLTAPLTEYVTTRVGVEGDYDNASEYVRDLIRRDRERRERRAFEELKATLQKAFDQPDEAAVELDFETFMARHKPVTS